ncbi:MAG: hypothetical protein ACRYHB_02700 [Janthinobacterium lividum]
MKSYKKDNAVKEPAQAHENGHPKRMIPIRKVQPIEGTYPFMGNVFSDL